MPPMTTNSTRCLLRIRTTLPASSSGTGDAASDTLSLALVVRGDLVRRQEGFGEAKCRLVGVWCS